VRILAARNAIDSGLLLMRSAFNSWILKTGSDCVRWHARPDHGLTALLNFSLDLH
jgi:hypothetical protein